MGSHGQLIPYSPDPSMVSDHLSFLVVFILFFLFLFIAALDGSQPVCQKCLTFGVKCKECITFDSKHKK